VLELTVATDVVLLDHVPPPEPVSVVVEAAHKLEAPIIAEGVAFTVTVIVFVQPPDNV
jgi:hypothetical protein